MSHTPRFLPLLLAFCMFSTGASGLVNEYVLATITTYILGNSIEQFSIVIASMMLMMGVSGFVQSKMSDRFLLQKFIGVEVLMALLGAFAPLAIYAAFGYMNEHFTLVLFFFILSIGFLIGFEIPLVMRIIDAQNIQLKTNLTIVYAMDYIGAFVGAIIWVKFLLLNFPLTEISFIVAGFNFFIAAIAILYFLKQRIIQSPVIILLIIISTAYNGLFLRGCTQAGIPRGCQRSRGCGCGQPFENTNAFVPNTFKQHPSWRACTEDRWLYKDVAAGGSARWARQNHQAAARKWRGCESSF